jgi:two-component system, sensor histidine kinase and response regulator
MDARYAQLPVVAMTAHATAEERVACLTSGMQDHIPKPIDPDHFYQTLARWLGAPTGSDEAMPADQVPPDSDVPIRVPGFDTDEALRRLGGDVVSYHHLLELLVRCLNDAIEQLQCAQGSADRAAIQSAVHSLHGMAANVGARALAECARMVELRLREPGSPLDNDLKADVHALQTLTQDTLETLRGALAQRQFEQI